MKKIILILLIFISLSLSAQIKVKDESFKKTNESIELDDEYGACALIKISTENIKKSLMHDFEFSNDAFYFDSEIKMKTIKLKVYEGVESIWISHLTYGDFEYVFPEKIIASCVYEMTLVHEEEVVVDTLQNIITIRSYPSRSKVFIDRNTKDVLHCR